jgi:hypothetical protein
VADHWQEIVHHRRKEHATNLLLYLGKFLTVVTGPRRPYAEGNPLRSRFRRGCLLPDGILLGLVWVLPLC